MIYELLECAGGVRTANHPTHARQEMTIDEVNTANRALVQTTQRWIPVPSGENDRTVTDARLDHDVSKRLAEAALADEAALVDAPWTIRRDIDESADRVEDRDPDEFTVLDGAGMWVAKVGSDQVAADFIAAARSREPKLAREVLRQAEEIELLRRELGTWQRAVGRLDNKYTRAVYAWVKQLSQL